jgi:hypothetical protein
MRCRSEQPGAPRQGNTDQPKRGSRRRQAERGGKACRDAEQADRHPASRLGVGIACQPLGPGEPIMGTLGTGKRRRRRSEARLSGRLLLHVNPLVPEHLMQARRCCLRLQSRQSSGGAPTRSGCKSMLTWRGLAVARPCHWHCSRNGQGRQLRMLAPYTTRKLPSASRRRSCGISFCPAGQSSVPSGWRAKSRPEKRPRFQGWACSAGLYPCMGTGEMDASALAEGWAGENSVVRTGSGASRCPSGKREQVFAQMDVRSPSRSRGHTEWTRSRGSTPCQ